MLNKITRNMVILEIMSITREVFGKDKDKANEMINNVMYLTDRQLIDTFKIMTQSDLITQCEIEMIQP